MSIERRLKAEEKMQSELRAELNFEWRTFVAKTGVEENDSNKKAFEDAYIFGCCIGEEDKIYENALKKCRSFANSEDEKRTSRIEVLKHDISLEEEFLAHAIKYNRVKLVETKTKRIEAMKAELEMLLAM